MSSNQKMNNLKKNLSLNLEQAKNGMGMQITTPDLMCNVNTPELERIILSNNISTNTPIITPSTNNILFPKIVTKEQDAFATGFMDVLNNLHNNNSQASDSGNGIDALGSDNDPQLGNNLTGTFLSSQIKEEPQTVPNIPNSPPLSPVDMEHQERIKLERKRQRNRLAASKCRSRKLERISKLEDRVKQLKSENVELGSVLNQLKEHVGTLKLEVMDHVHAGCNIIMQ